MKRQAWYHSYWFIDIALESRTRCVHAILYTIIPPRLFQIHSYMHFTLPVNFKASVKRGWVCTCKSFLNSRCSGQTRTRVSWETESWWELTGYYRARRENSHQLSSQVEPTQSWWECMRATSNPAWGKGWHESWRANASEICNSDQLSSSFDRCLKYVVR